MGNGKFYFNNQEATLDNNDWNNKILPKLWLYNLHYHEWLFDLDRGHTDWIEKWICDNPLGHGNGWEPYPLSLRLFNWIKLSTHLGLTPPRKMQTSIGQQATILFQNLEFQHGANHLLENLFALKTVSLFFKDDKAHQRINHLLEFELEQQFQDDGSHFELSPMYHSILVERMLDLLNIWPTDNNDHILELIKNKAMAALNWLEVMTVNKNFSLFNDASFDSAPVAGALLDYGEKLIGWKSRLYAEHVTITLKPSGYYRFHNQHYTIIWDCGQLGPDYNLAHAHCDMFSYCLWIGNIPIIIDSGNYDYTPGGMRYYCRSTAAHNTCMLDNQDQAEIWAVHRIGRRGYPSHVNHYKKNGKVVFKGRHNSYRHLQGRPMVTRQIEMSENMISITDIIYSNAKHLIKSFIHLHPYASCEILDKTVNVRQDNKAVAIQCSVSPYLEKGWYCPEFGKKFPNTVIVLQTNKPSLNYSIKF